MQPSLIIIIIIIIVHNYNYNSGRPGSSGCSSAVFAVQCRIRSELKMIIFAKVSSTVLMRLTRIYNIYNVAPSGGLTNLAAYPWHSVSSVENWSLHVVWLAYTTNGHYLRSNLRRVR